MANVSLADVRDTINVGNADVPDEKLQKMVTCRGHAGVGTGQGDRLKRLLGGGEGVHHDACRRLRHLLPNRRLRGRLELQRGRPKFQRSGDTVHVTLPNENVDSDFRVASAEYNVDAKTQTLETNLELGREAPQLADYVFALRSKLDHVSRYKTTRRF